MGPNTTLSVCIVDDDAIFSRTLEHHLKEKLKTAVSFRLFQTGEEFLKSIRDNKPDVVILDYMLNGLHPFAMDGRAVLQKIRQEDPDITVIMVSGQDKIEVALESIKEGAYDYVIKNDNVFLKMQTVMKNAIRTVVISKKLKMYRKWFSAALIFFSVGILIELLFLAFY
jgi:DNA-binding NtrC family response regulator